MKPDTLEAIRASRKYATLLEKHNYITEASPGGHGEGFYMDIDDTLDLAEITEILNYDLLIDKYTTSSNLIWLNVCDDKEALQEYYK